MTASVPLTAGPRLLERDDEVAVLAGAVAAAEAGAGELVAVAADAGLGKSALLDAAARLAGERRLRVLRARGSELESEFPLGIVLQLLEPAVPARRHFSERAGAAVKLLKGQGPA